MGYEVAIYPMGERDNVIVNFYKKLNPATRRKIVKVLKHIEEYGLSKDINDIKKLQGYDFWEIRILGKDNIRLFVTKHNQIIYVLHIFRKKSQTTATKDLKITQSRLVALRNEFDK